MTSCRYACIKGLELSSLRTYSTSVLKTWFVLIPEWWSSRHFGCETRLIPSKLFKFMERHELFMFMYGFMGSV